MNLLNQGTNLFLLHLDGKIKQKQEQILEGDLIDEGHDEACQEEAFERELYHILRP